jgi:hypothetical protein
VDDPSHGQSEGEACCGDHPITAMFGNWPVLREGERQRHSYLFVGHDDGSAHVGYTWARARRGPIELRSEDGYLVPLGRDGRREEVVADLSHLVPIRPSFRRGRPEGSGMDWRRIVPVVMKAVNAGQTVEAACLEVASANGLSGAAVMKAYQRRAASVREEQEQARASARDTARRVAQRVFQLERAGIPLDRATQVAAREGGLDPGSIRITTRPVSGTSEAVLSGPDRHDVAGRQSAPSEWDADSVPIRTHSEAL